MKNCKYCGAVIENENDTTCQYCGNPIENEIPPQPQTGFGNMQYGQNQYGNNQYGQNPYNQPNQYGQNMSHPGYTLNGQQYSSMQNVTTCSKCGASMSGDSDFCPFCGAKVK